MKAGERRATTRHHHVGPEEYACPGCLDEAAEITDELRRERFWQLVLVLFLIALVMGSMLGLSWAISKYVPRMKQEISNERP